MSGEYILEFKNKKFLLVNHNKSELKHEILAKISNKEEKLDFNLLKFEVFHKKFNIFYDLNDDDDDLPCEGRLRISVRSPPSLSEDSILMCDESEVRELDPPVSVECKTISSSNPCKEKITWPETFTILHEEMPQSLILALNRPTILADREKSSLMEFLYEKISHFTFYPTRDNFGDVVRALFAMFPKLKGDNYSTATEYWKVRLFEKFRNMRKRRDRMIPDVTNKRARMSTPAKSLQNNQFGFDNYLPDRPISEDDASLQRNIDLLGVEMKRSNPDQSTVDHLMNLTFFDRRHKIVQLHYSLEKLHEIYPILFNCDQLCLEFLRISGIRIRQKLRETITTNATALKNLLNMTDAEDFDDNTIDELLRSIPILLKEKMESDSSVKVLAPCIKFEEDHHVYKVICEGIVLGVTNELLDAWAVWFAAHATFNISYPKRLKKTLIFTQKYLLNITDQSKTPQTVFKLIEKLESY